MQNKPQRPNGPGVSPEAENGRVQTTPLRRYHRGLRKFALMNK